MLGISYEEDDDDSFGPGTDLVLSILAVFIVLVLAGNQYYKEQIGTMQTEKSEIKEELSESENEIAYLKKLVEVIRETLKEKEEEKNSLESIIVSLESEIKDLINALEESNKKIDSNEMLEEVINKLNQRLSRLEDKLVDRERENENLRKKVVLLTEEQMILKKRNKILYTIQESDSYRKFEKGKAELTTMAKKEIKNNLKVINQAFGKNNKEANQIDVVGYASAEPFLRVGGGYVKDKNLNLSADRAISVAHYLASLGIPYECISTRGVGRSRSSVLQKWLRQDKRRTLQQWDSRWFGGNKELMKKKYESKLNKERRIEIRAVYDKESSCNYKN